MSNIKKTNEETSLSLFNQKSGVKTAQDLEKMDIRDLRIKEALHARLQKMIRNETDMALEALVSVECMRAMERIGQNNMESDRSQIIQEDVLAHLKSRCFNWTANEIVIALRMGALGELGEPPRHLTSQNMIGWLNQYDTQVRRKATQELKRASERANRNSEDKLIEEPQNLSLEQKKKLVLDQYNHFLNQESILGVSKVFKILTHLKALNVSKEDRWEYISKAGDVVAQEAKEAATNPVMRTAARQRLDQIKRIEIGKAGTVPEFIKSRAQELAIIDFFKKCKELNVPPINLSVE